MNAFMSITGAYIACLVVIFLCVVMFSLGQEIIFIYIILGTLVVTRLYISWIRFSAAWDRREAENKPGRKINSRADAVRTIIAYVVIAFVISLAGILAWNLVMEGHAVTGALLVSAAKWAAIAAWPFAWIVFAASVATDR